MEVHVYEWREDDPAARVDLLLSLFVQRVRQFPDPAALDPNVVGSAPPPEPGVPHNELQASASLGWDFFEAQRDVDPSLRVVRLRENVDDPSRNRRPNEVSVGEGVATPDTGVREELVDEEEEREGREHSSKGKDGPGRPSLVPHGVYGSGDAYEGKVDHRPDNGSVEGDERPVEVRRPGDNREYYHKVDRVRHDG